MKKLRGLLFTSLSLLITFSLAEAKADNSAWQVKKVEVNGLNMAYYEIGQGKPILMLHGNPTSSYQWRNIIPYVQHLGRVIAPDMIGMGYSDPLPGSGPGKYTYKTHREYLFNLFEKLEINDNVTLIVHDWGSAIGFDWAYQNPDKVRGIAYFEAIVRPPSHFMPDTTGGMFVKLNSPAGEKMVLEKNMMVERKYIDRLGYYLSEQDKAEFRRPYLQPGESRRPTLAWARQLPLGGKPQVNDEIFKAYSQWLAEDTEIPKLFLRGEPGALLANPLLLDFVRTFKNQQELMIYGAHNLHETSPDAIGRALSEWISNLN